MRELLCIIKTICIYNTKTTFRSSHALAHCINDKVGRQSAIQKSYNTPFTKKRANKIILASKCKLSNF